MAPATIWKLLPDFPSLLEFLSEQQAPHVRDPGAPAVILHSRLGQQRAPVSVRWVVGDGAVYIEQQVPVHVPQGRVAEVAILVARINHALQVPGFGLDPDTGALTFRLVALLDLDGMLPVQHLQDLLATAAHTVGDHLAVLQASAAPPPRSATSDAPLWWSEEE